MTEVKKQVRLCCREGKVICCILIVCQALKHFLTEFWHHPVILAGERDLGAVW